MSTKEKQINLLFASIVVGIFVIYDPRCEYRMLKRLIIGLPQNLVGLLQIIPNYGFDVRIHLKYVKHSLHLFSNRGRWVSI